MSKIELPSTKRKRESPRYKREILVREHKRLKYILSFVEDSFQRNRFIRAEDYAYPYETLIKHLEWKLSCQHLHLHNGYPQVESFDSIYDGKKDKGYCIDVSIYKPIFDELVTAFIIIERASIFTYSILFAVEGVELIYLNPYNRFNYRLRLEGEEIPPFENNMSFSDVVDLYRKGDIPPGASDWPPDGYMETDVFSLYREALTKLGEYLADYAKAYAGVYPNHSFKLINLF